MQFPSLGQGLPGQAVPIPGRAQPFQIPPFVDPAGIIMQAAQLRQQRELAQQQLAQQAAQHLTDTINSVASLQEKKREADMTNAVAEAHLQMQEGQIEAERPLWQAHAAALQQQAGLYKSQANMLAGGNNGYMDSMQKVHAGTMDPDEFFNGFSSRNGMKATMQNMYNAIYPGDNITNLKNQWSQANAAARVAGGVNVQIPIAMAKGVEALTSDLAQRAKELGFTRFPLVNKAIIASKTAIGDPGMQDYLLRNIEAQKQLAQVFQAGGSPTDFAARSASEALRPELGPDALTMVNSSTIPSMIGARVGALQMIGKPAIAQSANVGMRPKTMTRILKNGQQVNVIDNGDGTFTRIP